MKRNRVIVAGLSLLMIAVVCILQVAHVQAAESEELNNISQNCASIKQSLAQLQRADSRTRTYLGSAYEKIARDFITPLSLRLSRNNYNVEEITNIEKQFSETQMNFRNYYTEYMRDLDGLIATDCQSRPQEFYDRLKDTRKKREALHTTAQQLSELINKQSRAVKKLQESL